MSTRHNNAPIDHSKQPDRRRRNKANIAATLSATIAIAAGGAGVVKVVKETNAYNNRADAALVNLEERKRAVDESRTALNNSKEIASVGTFQKTLDSLEVEKLPEVVKDGKHLGYEPAFSMFTLPDFVSEKQRAKIAALSVPITQEQFDQWSGGVDEVVDPGSLVKPDYNHYTNSMGFEIEYIAAEKLEKYKALCDELDAANAAAIPHYQSAAEADMEAAKAAYEHLQAEEASKSDWVIFSGR